LLAIKFKARLGSAESVENIFPAYYVDFAICYKYDALADLATLVVKTDYGECEISTSSATAKISPSFNKYTIGGACNEQYEYRAPTQTIESIQFFNGTISNEVMHEVVVNPYQFLKPVRTISNYAPLFLVGPPAPIAVDDAYNVTSGVQFIGNVFDNDTYDCGGA